MTHRMIATTVDCHTDGEPFRFANGGVGPIPARPILDRRRFALAHLDEGFLVR